MSQPAATAAPKPEFVDTHAHLDDPAFDRDRDAVIASALTAGVRAIVNVGYRPARWATTIALAKRHRSVAIALGLHPHHADELTADTCERLGHELVRSDAVALGEIGLDYFRDGPDRAVQRAAFEAQLALGRRLGRPIIVHQRAAEDDLIDVLRRCDDLPAVILHSFEGSLGLARFARDRGYLIGVGGLATRGGSASLRQVLATIPVDSILLETDSPYLTPAGVKDRRNTPANLPAIAERLAPLWGVAPEQLAAQTSATAERVFQLAPADRSPTTDGPR